MATEGGGPVDRRRRRWPERRPRRRWEPLEQDSGRNPFFCAPEGARTHFFCLCLSVFVLIWPKSCFRTKFDFIFLGNPRKFLFENAKASAFEQKIDEKPLNNEVKLNFFLFENSETTFYEQNEIEKTLSTACIRAKIVIRFLRKRSNHADYS